MMRLMGTSRTSQVAGAVVGAFVACAWGPAQAGGVSRPNPISARGVGNGGAFVAIADDPTALHFNPAGAAWADAAFMIGAELVAAPRSYKPADGGPSEDTSPVAPVPVLGVLFRTSEDDVPSRLTFGVGFWNTFGGSLEYERMGPTEPAVNSTEELVLELAAGAAVEVSEKLSLGATVRLGLGLFAVNATAHPLDEYLSSRGVGAGFTLGAMLRPVDAVTIGAVWRSPLTINTTGTGTIAGISGEIDAEHEQPWPQQASLGVTIRVAPPMRVSLQADWTDWSRWERVDIIFPNNTGLSQHLPLNWSDSYAAHLGVDYQVSPGLALRGGGYYDSNAVPDRTIERIYLDDDKFGVSLGSTIGLGASWRLDLAGDVTLPNSRKVPNTTADSEGWGTRANMFPGEHGGYIVSFELAAARRF